MNTEKPKQIFQPFDNISAYEKIVLGTMIIFPKCIPTVASIITGPYFQQNTGHNVIYQAILNLEKNGEEITFGTVIAESVANKSLEPMKWMELILNLHEYVFSDTNIEHFCKKVTDAYYMNCASQELYVKNRKYDNGEYANYELFLRDIAESQAKLERFQSKKNMAKSEDIIKLTTQRVMDKCNGEKKPGINTGYRLLDWLTGGFQGQYMVVIAARPAVGKTSLALNMATNMFYGTDENNVNPNSRVIGFFSYEMGADMLVEKIVSYISGVSLHNIRTGKMDYIERSRYQYIAEKISKNKFFIDDSATHTIADIRAKAIMWKMMCDKEYEITKDENELLGAIFVDYLQLVPIGAKSHSRTLEVGEIAQGLKNLSMELKIPVVVLSQLSRDVEKRRVAKKSGSGWCIPVLSDLRDSGAIEQAADIVIFVARKDETGKDTEVKKTQMAKMYIAKNRHGPVGAIPLIFYKQTASFLDDNTAEFEE